MEKAPFYLWERRKFWYYRLPGESSFHSTKIPAGTKASKRRAEQWVLDLIGEQVKAAGRGPAIELTFLDYARPYFVWDDCPRIRRRLDENKSIGREHARQSRRWLERYVFPDEFSALEMGAIRRADVLSLRDRVRQKAGLATTNKVISAVKAVFSEAMYREDIDRDPGAKIGPIKYEKVRRGLLPRERLAALFAESPGVWGDLRAYAVFNTAARTGMRSGEVLALTWSQINFTRREIQINRAWKSRAEIGLPKWNRSRHIPVVDAVLEPLSQLREDGVRVGDADLVFCYEQDGSRLGETWWRKTFVRVADREQLATGITAHSLRHSLNTQLVAAGCDPAKVRAYFGWSDGASGGVLSAVQAAYTHWSPGDLAEVAMYIETIFST